MEYTKEKYKELLEQLEDMAEEGYKAFHQKLVPGLTDLYGIRSPKLRALAKELCKGDWHGYLAHAQDTTYEEVMLQGMVIDAAKCDIETRLEYVNGFVPKIDNWAVCDGFCTGLKATKKNLPRVRAFLEPYLESKREYDLRFAAVMLMCYYVDDTYIDDTLQRLNQMTHEGYYVKMAVAWALSLCFVKQRDKTLALFQNNTLDTFTYNKALQKCRESYRVSKEDKALLQEMKRKE